MLILRDFVIVNLSKQFVGSAFLASLAQSNRLKEANLLLMQMQIFEFLVTNFTYVFTITANQ